MPFIICRLSRSGFSGERVFRVALADGTEHVGVAPVDYCRTIKGEVLGPDSPPEKTKIKGLVEAELIDDSGEDLMVAVPDGQTIIVKREAFKESLPNVPV